MSKSKTEKKEYKMSQQDADIIFGTEEEQRQQLQQLHQKMTEKKKYSKNIDSLTDSYSIARLSDDTTDTTLAQIFSELYGDVFLSVPVQKDNKTTYKMYHWTGVYWDTNGAENALHVMVANRFYKEMMHATIDYCTPDENEDKALAKLEKEAKIKIQDKLTAFLKSLRKHNSRKGIVEEMKIYLVKQVEFDTKNHLFLFRDKVWDLYQGKFVEPNPTDYMTMTCRLNYRPPTEVERQTLRKVLSEIFPVESKRRFYMKLMSTGMCGEQLQNIIIANQGGGNGKSVMHGLIKQLLGDYFYRGNNATIQTKLKVGSCPEIANMSKKRFVLFSEPSKESKLCGSTLKDITGNKDVNARKNYDNDTETKLCNTTVIECNDKPPFDEVTEGISRRIIDCGFDSYFKPDPENWVGLANVFERNTLYETDEWQQQHAFALFEVLTEAFAQYRSEGLAIPKEIEQRGLDYLATCDEFQVWFQEMYEKTGNVKEDYVSVADLYDEMKGSEWWQDLSKMQRRKRTKKATIQEISRSLHLRAYYRDHFDVKDAQGKRHQLRNVIVGHKLAPRDDAPKKGKQDFDGEDLED